MNKNEQPKPTNYNEALKLLNGRWSLKLANNTYLEMFDEYQIDIRLHATNITSFFSNGETILCSGSHQTATTKERLNRYLPDGCKIGEIQGRWIYTAKTMTHFEDGIRINSITGEVL